MVDKKPVPKTINTLMRHLRDDKGIKCRDSAQKLRLMNMGYYHGYKGYRFRVKDIQHDEYISETLEFTDFDQIAALYDLDMRIKALIYPRIMAIETAFKSRILEATLAHSRSESFEDAYQYCLTNYRNGRERKSDSVYLSGWKQREKLRKDVSELVVEYANRLYIGHYIFKDSGVPLWAIFEAMTLGTVADFYDCLDERIQAQIVKDLGLPTNEGHTSTISSIFRALRYLRNAVAHNGVVIDVHRMRSGHSVANRVGMLIKNDMGVEGVSFQDITDYFVLITYLMRKLGFTKTECKQFMNGYRDLINGCYESSKRAGSGTATKAIPYPIFSKFIKSHSRKKIEQTMDFISHGSPQQRELEAHEQDS